MARRNSGNPAHDVALDAGEHVVRVFPQAGDEHHDPVRQDEQHEPAERDEVDRPHRLPVQQPPDQPNRFEIAGLCMRPVAIDTGAAMKTVMK